MKGDKGGCKIVISKKKLSYKVYAVTKKTTFGSATKSQDNWITTKPHNTLKLTETILKGCYIVEPVLFEDERGLFYESYQKEKLEANIGREINFVQDNVSISRKGVLRGLHFQKGIHAQAKLVHVLKGEVLDVIVDVRKGSPTFGKHYSTELSETNKKMFFLEKGIAHGFLALSDEVIFAYKCDEYYHPASESGIIYNDPTLGIDWNISDREVIISAKDLSLPLLKDIVL